MLYTNQRPAFKAGPSAPGIEIGRRSRPRISGRDKPNEYLAALRLARVIHKRYRDISPERALLLAQLALLGGVR